jgi:hypothetical protein
LIRRVVIQTKCSSIVASCRRAWGPTGARADGDLFSDYLLLSSPGGSQPGSETE